MAKFTDYKVTKEVQNIMEKWLQHCPNDFTGFDPEAILAVFTQGKKPGKKVARLKRIPYPYDVLIDEKVYIIDINEEAWKTLSEKKRAMQVYHLMCMIPEGAFDTESDTYGKVVKPDVEMFMREYKTANGIPNWIEDDSKLPDIFSEKPETATV